MKTMKKAVAVAAAIGMTVTGSGLSYASSATYPTAEISSTKMSDGDGATSEITGHIKVTSISVEVPVKSGFDIDPNLEVTAGGAGDTQMGKQATNYTIKNLSLVPLDITITNIAPETGVGLVDTVDALDAKDKNLLFAIREASEAVPNLPSAAGDAKWMTTTTVTTGQPYKVATDPDKNTILAKGSTKEVGGETVPTDSLTMKVYAATKKGWKADDKFIVTPTFTVSLHKDTPAAP